MENLNFTVDSALLSELGEKLVETVYIALVELVKNSYDADASWVKISFLKFGDGFEANANSTIIIEDDGVGMTEETLRDHWLSPATPVKRLGKITNDTTPKGRKIQGEKGLADSLY